MASQKSQGVPDHLVLVAYDQYKIVLFCAHPAGYLTKLLRAEELVHRRAHALVGDLHPYHALCAVGLDQFRQFVDLLPGVF